MKKRSKTWIEIVKSKRKTFPQGCCVTRVISDKRFKKPKYKGREWE